MKAKHLPWIFLAIVGAVYWIADMDTPVDRTPVSAAVAAEPEAPVIGDFIPDAVGGLYIVSDDGLWYAQDNVVQRVHTEGEVFEVVPLANGRAYAIGWDQMWLIEWGVAKPVQVRTGFTPLGERPVYPLPGRPGQQGLQDAAPLLGPDPRDDGR